MTATTEILPFAEGGSANVLSQAAYAALSTILLNGYQSGILPSNLLNKTLRQSSFMAAGLAEFCVSQGVSIPDDGDLSALVTNLETALAAFITAQGGGGALLAANNLSDLASLTTAVSNLGFVTSASANGYVKLPGGIIIQWGSGTTGGGGTVAVTFPLTFPSALYSVSLGLASAGTLITEYTSPSTSGFTLTIANATGGAGAAGTTTYIAIGK